jgi:DNA-directed RNA polymerase sigma subunit (sigma70/sigma32)
MKYAERVLMQKKGRDPTAVEIANQAKMHPERVTELMWLSAGGTVSLDSRNSDKFQEDDEE